MAFDSTDPSTWGVDFGRNLSPEEVAYYAPTMQQNYDRNQGMAAVYNAAGLNGSQWTDIYNPGGAVAGGTSATPQGNKGTYNSIQNTGSISAGPSDPSSISAKPAQSTPSAAQSTTMPIGTSAKTYNPTQIANVKGSWADFLSGKRDASSIMADMNTYGVSMSDMASTLGLTPAEVASKLGAPNGFGGYSAAPGLISGAMATPTAMTVNPATSVNSTNYTAATTPGANVWSAAADVNASTAGPAVLAKSNPWDVTTNQTVAGQIQGLIDPNSPLIQQARTGALQQMAARGLQNSSMALTAGDSAAYTAALPIATADAGTYSKAASYNADINNQMAVTNANAQNSINVSNAAQQNQVALQNQQQKNTVGLTNTQETNKANQFDTAQKNTVGLTNAQQQNQVALANAQQENAVKLANASQQNNLTQAAMTTQTQKAIADLNAQTQMWSATLDANTKTSLQKLTNENSVLLKTNDTAASIMNAATAALNNIQMSGLTDKTGASAQVWQNLTAMMNVLSKTSGLDLSSMLTSNPYPASGTSQTPGGTNTTPEPPPNNTQGLT